MREARVPTEEDWVSSRELVCRKLLVNAIQALDCAADCEPSGIVP